MLASVQKIIAIRSIPDATNIEVASVLGWEVVVKKGEYKAGDYCCYIQIDTIVPELPQYEFLRERKFRVRTVKLRGQISQGLIVPIPTAKLTLPIIGEGMDLTDVMGVKKYSKDEVEVIEKVKAPKVWYKKWVWMFKQNVYWIFPFLKPKPSKGRFPIHLVTKTDETRIQNKPRVLETHKGKLFVVTEKLDGSSITIIHEKWGKYRICSRNLEMLRGDDEFTDVFNTTAFAHHIKKLVTYFETDNIIVQGEYIGKPQKNKYKLKANEIRLFNIYVDGKRIAPNVFASTCRDLAIPCCPIVDYLLLNMTMQEIIAYADGKSTLNDSVDREGVVFRCVEDNLSFKVISNKFLLKNEE